MIHHKLFPFHGIIQKVYFGPSENFNMEPKIESEQPPEMTQLEESVENVSIEAEYKELDAELESLLVHFNPDYLAGKPEDMPMDEFQRIDGPSQIRPFNTVNELMEVFIELTEIDRKMGKIHTSLPSTLPKELVRIKANLETDFKKIFNAHKALNGWNNDLDPSSVRSVGRFEESISLIQGTEGSNADLNHYRLKPDSIPPISTSELFGKVINNLGQTGLDTETENLMGRYLIHLAKNRAEEYRGAGNFESEYHEALANEAVQFWEDFDSSFQGASDEEEIVISDEAQQSFQARAEVLKAKKEQYDEILPYRQLERAIIEAENATPEERAKIVKGMGKGIDYPLDSYEKGNVHLKGAPEELISEIIDVQERLLRLLEQAKEERPEPDFEYKNYEESGENTPR